MDVEAAQPRPFTSPSSASFSLTVTSAADSGPGTLRDVLTTIRGFGATNAWTVGFSPTLAGQTINLSTIGNFDFGYSALLINLNVTIDGSAAPGISRSTGSCRIAHAPVLGYARKHFDAAKHRALWGSRFRRRLERAAMAAAAVDWERAALFISRDS